MPKLQRLDAAQPWVQLSTTAADWKRADPALLATMLGELHLIRAFEETVLELAGEGLVHGPAHSSIGQEGGAVGSIVGMRSTDAINGSHRGHHQFLAKAITHVSRRLARPRRAGDERPAERSAAHARRDPRPGAGILPGPRRLDAPAVVRGGGARHERHRRRRRPARRGQRVGAEARGNLGCHRELLRRRRDQHRLGARVDEPHLGVEAAAGLLHREQPLRRLHHGGGGDRGATALRARPRLRHPLLAG